MKSYEHVRCWCISVFFLSFLSHRPKGFWNDWKILSHFGQNVWKYRLKNTVMVSFDTTVRQMTEMFQCPKCLSKKWPKCFSEKKQAYTMLTSKIDNLMELINYFVVLFFSRNFWTRSTRKPSKGSKDPDCGLVSNKNLVKNSIRQLASRTRQPGPKWPKT